VKKPPCSQFPRPFSTGIQSSDISRIRGHECSVVSHRFFAGVTRQKSSFKSPPQPLLFSRRAAIFNDRNRVKGCSARGNKFAAFALRTLAAFALRTLAAFALRTVGLWCLNLLGPLQSLDLCELFPGRNTIHAASPRLSFNCFCHSQTKLVLTWH